MRSIPRCEQETVIRWAADEDRATISTSNPAVIRKLDKLTETAPEEYRKERGLTDDHDARYTTRVGLIRFAKPLSEANRELRKSLAARINSDRKNAVSDVGETTSSNAADSLPT